LDALEAQRNLGAVTVYGDAGGAQVLKAARLDGARVLVVTNSELVDKVRICLAARQVNPHVVIVATSSTAAERAWLHEFGVAHICDAQDELTESLIRSIRSIL